MVPTAVARDTIYSRPVSSKHFWQQPQQLVGAAVCLEPMTPDHVPALAEILTLDTFQHFLNVVPLKEGLDGTQEYIESLLQFPNTHSYAVRDTSNHRIVGQTCFLDMIEAHRHVEIGMTWYAKDVRGTHINPASKLLLLEHSFECLNCQRVTLKTDATNVRSRAAILKLGAQFEGVLRSHRIRPNGTPRDTAYFSILSEEWPIVRQRLLSRLGTFAR